MTIDYLKNTAREFRDDFTNADTTGKVTMMAVFTISAVLSFVVISVIISFAVKVLVYLLPAMAAAAAVAWYMTRKK